MDKFFNHKIVKNKRGQSTVEYILLLAVLASLGVTVFNNKKFKKLLGGQEGLFSDMKKSMAYTYRYGRMYKDDAEYDKGMSFNYSTTKHDTFIDSSGKSHFFMGSDKYPQ